MQKEIIYPENAHLFLLEPITEGYELYIRNDQTIRPIKDVESIGIPFGVRANYIETKIFPEINPFIYTDEFRELTNPIRIMSTLEHYLNEAKINISYEKKERNFIQHLGFTAGKAINKIVPCQFYLIKDKF
jgi:hypothetical protein